MPEEVDNKIKKDEKKSPKTATALAIEFFIKVAATVLIVFLLCTFVIGIHVNHSNSNYPMLKDGDFCVTFRHARVYIGDEIVYNNDRKLIFGRVAAMPGDVIDIDGESLVVNGKGVYENAVYPTTAEGAKITFPYTVPEDSVFVLNDYRSDINDSRTYGAISKSDIEGKVVFILRRRGI